MDMGRRQEFFWGFSIIWMEGGTGGARDGCWVVGIPSGITGLLEVDLSDLQLTELVPARCEV